MLFEITVKGFYIIKRLLEEYYLCYGILLFLIASLKMLRMPNELYWCQWSYLGIIPCPDLQQLVLQEQCYFASLVTNVLAFNVHLIRILNWYSDLNKTHVDTVPMNDISYVFDTIEFLNFL